MKTFELENEEGLRLRGLEFGLQADCYVCRASAGAGVIA